MSMKKEGVYLDYYLDCCVNDMCMCVEKKRQKKKSFTVIGYLYPIPFPYYLLFLLMSM